MSISQPNNVILFDGICNFCSGAVRFILKRDQKAVFKFAPLQSETGRKIQTVHGRDPDDIQTFLLIKNGTVYDKTDAAIEILKDFSFPWQPLRLTRLVPKPFRDWFYDLLAKNRYRWFGKKESCMIPDNSIRSRFLE